jgi:hypothetical protein
MEVNFGAWFERALAVYKVHWLPLVILFAAVGICVGVPQALVQSWLLGYPLLTLLFQLAVVVAVTGPVMIGIARYVLRLFDHPDQAVDLGAAFRAALEGYQQFKDAALLFLIIGGVGFVAQYVLGLFLWPFLTTLGSALISFFVATAFMFSMWLMAEHKCGFQAALSGSWSAVKDNFHVFLIFHLMALGVGIAGVIACGIGVVATVPLYFCLMAVAFREVFPHLGAAEPAAEPPPPAATPAP